MARGFRRLARATEVIGPYAGVTGNARRAWARDNPETLTAFIRAWRDAVAWLTDAANAEAVLAQFGARMGGTLAPATARAACALLLDPARGLRRDLSIDPEGMRTVLRLRSTYAEPPRELRDPDRYTDLQYLEAAARG